MIKGVNLGGWLVLEKWMTPALFEGSGAADEYYLPEGTDRALYREKIRSHRATFITERDFISLKSHGFECARIPVPYFAFGDRPPFIGCLKELDRAFDLAEAYGMSVLLDLHTVPLSQNGFDNGGLSGVCRFAQTPCEVEFALGVLERLAERYGQRAGLYGIEVLNEPLTQKAWALMDIGHRYPPADPEMARGSGPVSLEFLRDFYLKAYARLKPRLAPSKKIVFHDGFDFLAWRDFMQDDRFEGIQLDTHQYLMMAELMGCPRTIGGYLDFIASRWAPELESMSRVCEVIVGEWCLFNSYCLGYDSKGGQSVLNGVTGVAKARDPESFKADYQRLYKAFMQAYAPCAGNFYWSFKMLFDSVSAPVWKGWESWDLERCLNLGWYM